MRPRLPVPAGRAGSSPRAHDAVCGRPHVLTAGSSGTGGANCWGGRCCGGRGGGPGYRPDGVPWTACGPEGALGTWWGPDGTPWTLYGPDGTPCGPDGGIGGCCGTGCDGGNCCGGRFAHDGGEPAIAARSPCGSLSTPTSSGSPLPESATSR